MSHSSSAISRTDATFLAKHSGVYKTEAFTVLMLLFDPIVLGISVLLGFTVPICRNEVIQERIDFRSGREPNGATFNQF